MRESPLKVRPRHARGFTLIELLIVIGIIVVLAAILIPTISHIRTTVHQTATAARVQALMSAIDNYYHANSAYPGPLADSELNNPGGQPTAFPVTDLTTGKTIAITGTENLTLGLCGGLYMKTSGTTSAIVYDPTKVGSGALGLYNYKAPQRYGPYITDTKAAGLEPQYTGGVWLAWNDPNHPGDHFANQNLFSDSAVPEFMDAYPDAMPILYIRAVNGASGSISGAPATNGTVQAGNAAYDPNQLAPYVFPAAVPGGPVSLIASNDTFANPPAVDPQVLSDFNQPANAPTPAVTPANYFGQYTSPATPRYKGYLLITAGPDRKYMTRDDTINNGSVLK